MSATAEKRQRCTAVRKDGQPCQALATYTGLCIGHLPQAAQWRARGGEQSSNANRAAKLLPSRLAPIAEGLERAFQAVETTDFDVRKATAMAAIARALIAVHEAGEYEERLRILEQQATDEGRFRDARNREKGPVQWHRTHD